MLIKLLKPFSHSLQITSFPLYAPKCTDLLTYASLTIHLTVNLLSYVSHGYSLNKQLKANHYVFTCRLGESIVTVFLNEEL